MKTILSVLLILWAHVTWAQPCQVERAEIRGEQMQTVSDLHQELARQLHFPGHYGANLDALYDVLTREICAAEVNFWQTTILLDRLGSGWVQFHETLIDVAIARPDIILNFYR